jgi:hypothetical protein
MGGAATEAVAPSAVATAAATTAAAGIAAAVAAAAKIARAPFAFTFALDMHLSQMRTPAARCGQMTRPSSCAWREVLQSSQTLARQARQWCRHTVKLNDTPHRAQLREGSVDGKGTPAAAAAAAADVEEEEAENEEDGVETLMEDWGTLNV